MRSHKSYLVWENLKNRRDSQFDDISCAIPTDIVQCSSRNFGRTIPIKNFLFISFLTLDCDNCPNCNPNFHQLFFLTYYWHSLFHSTSHLPKHFYYFSPPLNSVCDKFSPFWCLLSLLWACRSKLVKISTDSNIFKRKKLSF